MSDELSAADVLTADTLNEIGQRLRIDHVKTAQLCMNLDVDALLNDTVALYRHSKALAIGINVEVNL